MLAVDQNLWITVDITGGSRRPKLPRDSQNKGTDEQIHKFTRLAQATNAWTKGALSNFDYLLVINDFAGRKRGDIYNHPVVPWIADFTDPEGIFPRDKNCGLVCVSYGFTNLE
jgi:WD repeat-containing protein 81